MCRGPYTCVMSIVYGLCKVCLSNMRQSCCNPRLTRYDRSCTRMHIARTTLTGKGAQFQISACNNKKKKRARRASASSTNVDACGFCVSVCVRVCMRARSRHEANCERALATSQTPTPPSLSHSRKQNIVLLVFVHRICQIHTYIYN